MIPKCFLIPADWNMRKRKRQKGNTLEGDDTLETNKICQDRLHSDFDPVLPLRHTLPDDTEY